MKFSRWNLFTFHEDREGSIPKFRLNPSHGRNPKFIFDWLKVSKGSCALDFWSRLASEKWKKRNMAGDEETKTEPKQSHLSKQDISNLVSWFTHAAFFVFFVNLAVSSAGSASFSCGLVSQMPADFDNFLSQILDNTWICSPVGQHWQSQGFEIKLVE